jgi:fatty acid desaturase
MLGRLRGPVMVLAWFVRGFFGCAALAWPGLRNAYGRIFFGERSDLDLTRHAEIARCLRAEPSQALFFVALVPVALLLPQAFLVGCLLPLMLAGLFNANRVVAEHLHVRTTDRDPSTIVATTRTHDWGLAGRLFLFPRNIGFHVAHHLHPTVAMEHLPALDAWYRANEPGYRAPASIESILMQRPAAGTTEDGAAS